MTEPEFWAALERRLSREFAGMDDRALCFLWCDGFIPEEYALTDPSPQISGRVWIGKGPRQDRWRFSLILDRPAASREAVPWAALLPSEQATGWVSVDLARGHLRLTPSGTVAN